MLPSILLRASLGISRALFLGEFTKIVFWLTNDLLLSSILPLVIPKESVS
jgi:hypothetical protein